MKFFYLSSKINFDGKYEIHQRECKNLPDILDRDYLGPFNNGQEALRKAQKANEHAVLCESCCKEISQILSLKPLEQEKD